MSGPPTEWTRLHPFSPLLRGGRAVLALLVVAGQRGITDGFRGEHDLWGYVADAFVLVFAVLAGFVSWKVTRWRVAGSELQIETGLVRRQSIRLPLGRVQSIDIVRPLLARMLGLSEVRVDVAGRGSGVGRLAYLGEDAAVAVRARLLAVAHGLGDHAPEPAARPVITTSNARLVAAAALSMLNAVPVVAVLVVAALMTDRRALFALAAAAFPAVFGYVSLQARRISAEFSFTVAEAPDGLRLHGGLLQTRAETIPYGRVQAVRLVEPLVWRPFGWVRLEVDVARQHGPRSGGDAESAPVSRALLPVGTPADAAWLLHRVLPGAALVPPAASRPPARARLRAPVSWWNLRFSYDANHVSGRTGRLRRVTVVVPLEKVQSVRWTQGPLSRALRLSTVRVDTAGRNWQAAGILRDDVEAQAALEELARLARGARRQQRPAHAPPLPLPLAPPHVPPPPPYAVPPYPSPPTSPPTRRS